MSKYDVIKWKLFPRHWSFVKGIHRSPHKGQWHTALMTHNLYHVIAKIISRGVWAFDNPMVTSWSTGSTSLKGNTLWRRNPGWNNQPISKLHRLRRGNLRIRLFQLWRSSRHSRLSHRRASCPMEQDPLPAGRLPMLARALLENYIWHSFVKQFLFILHAITMSP